MSDEDLARKLQKWIQNNGYPLEMRVARAFRNEGAAAKLSHYYEAENELGFREIDVVATFAGMSPDDQRRKYIAEIHCVVECKHGRSKPWVGFIDDESTLKASSLWIRYPTTDYVAKMFSANIDIFMKSPVALFGLDLHAAYGITAVSFGDDKTRGDDGYNPAFNAVRQVVSAARAEIGTSHEGSLRVVVPIIVTEAPLFVCSIAGDSNEVRLTEVDRFVVAFANDGRFVPVQVTNESALPGLLIACRASIVQMLTMAEKLVQPPPRSVLQKVEERQAKRSPPR